MARKTITFSLDVEASGPIPGPWWMCSFAVCRTDDVETSFARELQPLQIEGLSEPDHPAAMEVVARGLPEPVWDPLGGAEQNVARVRAWFAERGVDPRRALEELRAWLTDQAGEDRAVVVGAPVTFDFMWLYWYWWRLLGEMPLFGFSGLDLRSYFMGMHGVEFLGTGKERYLKHYPNEFDHTHDPLDDARQQGALWRDMEAARRAGGKGFPPAAPRR